MRSCPLNKRPNSVGFTLLEMIGVMVVISVLFAAAVPSLVNLIRTQRSVDERLELPKIAAALKLGILREQRFPVYKNATAVDEPAEDGAYWWNLAARHGAGSANEARYPLGAVPDPDEVALGKANTRKLYFAKASWSKQTFFEITGDGEITDDQISNGWLANPLDPTELRLLLISTTNPDLSLPGTLSPAEFDAFWNHWAVGSDGNPASNDSNDSSDWSDWINYGLSSGQWEGRAPELNIERIDLRDWLCTVVIENRRAVKDIGGTLFTDPDFVGFWDRGSVYTSSLNLQAAEFVLLAHDTTEDLNSNGNLDSGEDANNNGFLDIGEDLNGNGILDANEDVDGDGFLDPPQWYTYVTAVAMSHRGKQINENEGIGYTVAGRRSFQVPAFESITKQLPRTDRAPIALLFPPSDDSPLALSGWENTDDSIQNRYFIKTQELLLGDPWVKAEVGIFTITENFSTLRFDGLQWHY